MADFCPMSRSNYFRVKDKEVFKKAIRQAFISNDVEVFEREDGRVAFGSLTEDITCYHDKGTDNMVDIDALIQRHIEDDEACIITVIGHEKLRYLLTSCAVITKNAVEWIDAENMAKQAACKLLGNDGKIFDMHC